MFVHLVIHFKFFLIRLPRFFLGCELFNHIFIVNSEYLPLCSLLYNFLRCFNGFWCIFLNFNSLINQVDFFMISDFCLPQLMKIFTCFCFFLSTLIFSLYIQFFHIPPGIECSVWVWMSRFIFPYGYLIDSTSFFERWTFTNSL